MFVRAQAAERKLQFIPYASFSLRHRFCIRRPGLHQPRLLLRIHEASSYFLLSHTPCRSQGIFREGSPISLAYFRPSVPDVTPNKPSPYLLQPHLMPQALSWPSYPTLTSFLGIPVALYLSIPIFVMVARAILFLSRMSTGT